MFSEQAWTCFAGFVLLSHLMGAECATTTPGPPFEKGNAGAKMTSYYLWRLRSELIEMLREKIYFVKENLANASYFPSTNQYFYNVSDIIYTYNHFFLLEEPRREVR